MREIKLPPEEQQPKIRLSHLLLLQASRMRKKLNEAVVEQCGITLPEKEVMMRVYRTGGQMRMSDVSNTLMFTDGGATKIINRLTDRGFVTRKRSEDDGRVILIDITDAGIDKLTDALHTMASVAYPIMRDAFSDEECEDMTGLLQRLDEFL